MNLRASGDAISNITCKNPGLPIKGQNQDAHNPDYLEDSQLLINRARSYSVLDIAELMQVSKQIAELNFQRFESWSVPFTP